MTGKSASLAVNIVADASRAVAAFDDTGEAGKRMADLIGKSADKLERELEATRKIADRLATALGPEMADAFGQSKIDDYARQMAKAGLTIEQVDANAEELTRQLQRLESAADQSASTMRRSMDGVKDSTDAAGNASRNFAGNVAGDLAQTAIPLGGLSEGIGQLTEGLLEGQIGFKGLAAAGAGMAAVGAIMYGINKELEKAAKIKAWRKAEVEGFKDAIMELGPGVDALTAKFQNGEKVIYRYMDASIDVTPILNNAGLSARNLALILDRGEQGIAEWTNRMIAAGYTEEQLTVITQTMTQQLDLYEESAKAAAVTTEFLGNSADFVAQRLNPYAEKLRDVEAGLWGLNDAQAALISLQTGQRSNVTNYTRSLSELSKVIDDPNTAINEQAVALEEAFAAGKDIAANYADQQRELAGLAGTTFGANDALQAQIDSLGVLSWTLEPDSPLRRNLAGYITQLEQQILLNGIIAGQQLAGQPGRVSLGGDRAQEYRAIAAAGAAGIPTLAVPGANLIPGLTPNMGANWMPNTIVVNMPAGSDGESVVRSLQEWQRNHGAIPVTTISTVIP